MQFSKTSIHPSLKQNLMPVPAFIFQQKIQQSQLLFRSYEVFHLLAPPCISTTGSSIYPELVIMIPKASKTLMHKYKTNVLSYSQLFFRPNHTRLELQNGNGWQGAAQGLHASMNSQLVGNNSCAQSTYKWHPCKDDHAKMKFQSSDDQQVWGGHGFQNLKSNAYTALLKIFNAFLYKVNEPSKSYTFRDWRQRIFNVVFGLIHKSQTIRFCYLLAFLFNFIWKLRCIKHIWLFILHCSFTLFIILLCKFFSKTFNQRQ